MPNRVKTLFASDLQLQFVFIFSQLSLIIPYLIEDLRDAPFSSSMCLISSLHTERGRCLMVSLSLLWGRFWGPLLTGCRDEFGFWSYNGTCLDPIHSFCLQHNSSLDTLSFTYKRNMLLTFCTHSSFDEPITLIRAVHIAYGVMLGSATSESFTNTGATEVATFMITVHQSQHKGLSWLFSSPH